MAARQNASALEVFYEKTKFVSAKFANFGAPFYSTISAALAAASGGDLIIVYPGTYTERITCSVMSVEMFFFPQTTVIDPATANGALISCTGSGTLSIFGYGIFSVTEGEYTIYAVDTTVAPLDIECEYIGGACSGIKINTNILELRCVLVACDILCESGSSINTIELSYGMSSGKS